MKQPIDTGNTDPKYWEEILETHLLGLRQLESYLQNEDDEPEVGATIVTQGRYVNKKHTQQTQKAYEILNSKIDSDEPFMGRGHHIINTRSRKKPIPDWALNDEEICKLLLKSFPKLGRPSLDRRRAARWAAIIHMYYRMNLTRGQIAKELRTTPTRIKLQLQHIRWAAAGYRADHSRRRDDTIPEPFVD